MKKGKFLLTIFISILFFCITINVYAISASISSPSSVTVGEEFTAKINMMAASWDVQISASGPVSGCSIHDANVTNSGTDESVSVNVACTATGEGTITLNLSGKIAGENDDSSTIVSDSKTVTVTKKQTQQPEPQEPTTVVVKPSNNNNNNNKNDKNDTKTETAKSKNTKVKEISIEGYKLTKIDDNNYTLSVENEVDKIKVKVVADDTKATVSGAGEKELEVGENKIEITITAEDGSTNKITIKVTRKEEEVITEPVIEIDDDVETPEPKNKINIISIIMIALNVILAISVIVLYRKNKKLKESIKK